MPRSLLNLRFLYLFGFGEIGAKKLRTPQERLESREARLSEVECAAAALSGDKAELEAALAAAGRRVRALQEETAALRTTAHQHHARALALQAQLADAQVNTPLAHYLWRWRCRRLGLICRVAMEVRVDMEIDVAVESIDTYMYSRGWGFMYDFFRYPKI